MEAMTRHTAPPTFTSVPCPLCGAAAATAVPFRAGPDRAHPRPGTFHLVRCARCGLVYQNPRPSAVALAGFYPPDYTPHTRAGRRSVLHRLGWRHGLELYRRCRFVRRHLAGGALLDVGCATGTFLAGIQDFGRWRVWGIEPALVAARVARARGLSVAVARFEDVRLAPASLDAVTLWDVLEHLPEPVATLARVRQALRPTGYLFLNVPTLDSLDAQLFGPYWCGLDLPRHLTLFDRRTLVASLRAAGLEPVTMGHPTGGHYSFTQSLRQAGQAALPPGPVQRALLRGAGLGLTKAALLPYIAATERTGHGASLTVAARPRA